MFRLLALSVYLSAALLALTALSLRVEADTPVAKPPAGIQDDELLVGRSDQYSKVVDQAVAYLVRGDAQGFRSMLSPVTIDVESRGVGAIDTIITSRFIPFFGDFVRLTDTVSTLPTHDAGNNPGLAIFRTFESTSGQERPFAVYVINQRGNYVVGNLLIDTTFEDARGAGGGGR